ncbi:MAG: archaeosortase/exosortase family protein [bacterium]|nr:archaeosortase/exosortase family protein [bacterium]
MPGNPEGSETPEPASAEPSGAAEAPTDRIRAHWSNPQVRYPLLVVAYLLVIGSAFNVALESLREPLEDLSAFTATSVHVFLRLFTDATTLRDQLVTYDGFAVSIIIECVGLLEMLIYSACVLAFPAPLRTRAAGVIFGCLAIFVFNLLRIVTLLLVGRYQGEYFDFFHVYFWQATLIAMIVSVLYGWIRIFVHR